MLQNESDSFEDDEIIKSIMDHNFAKPNRPKSQLFPDTAEVSKKKEANSSKVSKKTSPIFSPKPRTTRNSIISLKTAEEINNLSKKTSHEIIKSVYSLVSSKLPNNLYESSELTAKDQQEIQNFFMQKKKQFKSLLEEISHQSLKSAKRTPKDSLKSTQMIDNKYLQEIKRVQQKQLYLKKELIKKTSERILREKSVLKKKKELEDKKKKIEHKKIQNYEKDLIMKNIENFYKDKINIVKDYFQQEIQAKKVTNYEEKKFVSELIKEQKQNRIKQYCYIKQKYEKEIEDLIERFNSIH